MDELRTTRHKGQEAIWFVRDGVIRVTRIHDLDGHVEDLPGAPSLGECFDIMPRERWDQVRYEYESCYYVAPNRRADR